jgi:tyrosyl-tRNA synthetase
MIRKLEGATAHVYSFPLVINKNTGVKFGKSEAGAIWLDPARTSVFQFYQFWLNVDDESVGDYLKIFTLIEPDEHEKIMAEFQANPGERIAQKYLAHEVTKIVHGEAAAQSAQKVTETLFGVADVSELNSTDLELLAHEIPTVPLNTSLVGALVQTKAAASNGEARRLIESGAVSNNGEKILTDRSVNEISLIKKGKNNFILVK